MPQMSPAGPAPFRLVELARTLSRAVPSFLVWKGAHSTEIGGDLDGAAPAPAHDGVRRAFDEWTRGERLAATLFCTHAAGTSILVGCGGAAGERLLQLDLVHRKLLHGVPVWTAEVIHELAVEHAGVRHLPLGAEGVARLLVDSRDDEARAMTASDPAGARALAGRLGLRGHLASRTELPSRLALRLVLTARALAAPVAVVRSAATDGARRRCPVVKALESGRHLPCALDAWLGKVSRDHRVNRHA